MSLPNQNMRRSCGPDGPGHSNIEGLAYYLGYSCRRSDSCLTPCGRLLDLQLLNRWYLHRHVYSRFKARI